MRKHCGALYFRTSCISKLLITSILASGFVSAVKAQTVPETPQPNVRETVDANAVDLSTGSVQLPIASVSIGSGLDSIRVWTQLIQHLIAKMWSMARKFWAYFSKRVESLRISFILQKKRSTMLRMA
jgi:hypothetical protein